MLHRPILFLCGQLLGVGLGYLLHPAWGGVAGLALVSWGWFVNDLWRGQRVIRWLREGDLQQVPSVHGLWGEALDRARRLMRHGMHQIKASQRQLETVLEALQAAPTGIVMLDQSGHIEWYNQVAAHHFGFEPGRDLMQSISNLVRDPEFHSYLTSQTYAQGVVLQARGSTPLKPLRISVHLHPYGEGHRLMLSRDVTALEHADAMRRDFVANVSHEIRTPLTVLSGFVETLQTLPLGADERARYLHMMAQQADRMQNVVHDLLVLSRLEGSPPPGMLEWVEVQALLQRCEDDGHALSSLLTKGEPAHQLTFPAAECFAQEDELAGSEAELQSAISNLISNAIRYTPPGGRIVVDWRRLDDGRAVFSVQDTGPGIAPEHIPRLTERFYRVDRSRSRETGGTGLGLAIVKHVLQRHGATLDIVSVLGKGSTFSVTFPANRFRLYAGRRS